MQCPLCDVPMTEIEHEGVPIHTCDRCGGELVAGRSLARIVQERQEEFGVELKAALADREPVSGVSDAGGRQLECPGCSASMQVLNYAHDTGVHIDRCPACGSVWLDHEELEKVQVISEQWSDQASERLQSIASELEVARRQAAEATSNAFSGSRFAFVNALINRVLDIAA